MAISVGKELGNAVVRNRAKRLMREAFAREWQRLAALLRERSAGADVVLQLRRSAEESVKLIPFVHLHNDIMLLCNAISQKLRVRN